MRKRLPLTGTYNTRPGTLTLTGASAIAGLAIAGLGVSGAVRGSDKDHRLINCCQITEVDETAQSKRLYVVKRPGFAAVSTPRAGHVGNAIMVWTGQGSGTKVMSAFGNTAFTLYDGTTSKGSGSAKATGITETSISGTPTLYISAADNTAYTYQDGGSVTEITDVDFPGQAARTLVGTFAHLDGYPFIMDSTGRIYNGNLNSLTAWTANSYITANSTPDLGVGVVRNRDTLVGFCKTHFDVFRNAGNPTGSVLSRIDGMSQRVGAISADAMTKLRDVIYFAGTTDGASIGIYAYDLGQLKKVSPPELDALMTIAGASNITLTTLGYYGRNFIWIIADSSTYVYCVEENNWHEANGIEQLWYKAAAAQAGASIVNYAISSTSTSGKVFAVTPANIVYRDNGELYAASGQTTKWDAGTNTKKTMISLDVIGDKETSTSPLYIAFTDDDYQTSGVTRTVDLSSNRPRLTRCGRFSRRGFLYSHNANTPMRLEAFEVDVEIGST